VKLIRANFKNFRLLKDVELNFSTSSNKPLTVIRAANETGKTTSLNAIMWALYGSKHIDKKNGFYSATCLDIDGKGEVLIEVEIEFENEEAVERKGNTNLEINRYRLIRRCTEVVKNNTFKRQAESHSLFKVLPQGDQRIPDSESVEIINRSLPANLKDIYFTDGDAAMSFIEASADQRTKRKRVQSAIEALLSMDVLKSLDQRLEKVRAAFGRSIEKGDLSRDLTKLNERRSDSIDFLDGQEEEIDELSLEKQTFINDRVIIRSKIEDSLKLGDRDKLVSDIKSKENEIIMLNKRIVGEKNSLSDLLNDNLIASSLLQEKVKPALKILEDLKNDKQLPKQSIPLLTELLSAEICFCGSDLSLKTEVGKFNRQFIEEKIDSSEGADRLNSIATELLYAAKGDSVWKGNSGAWLDKFTKRIENEQQTAVQIRDAEKKLNELNEIVSKINDKALQAYRNQEKLLNKKIQEHTSIIGAREYEVTLHKSKLVTLNKEIEAITKKLSKKDDSAGKYKLTDDLKKIFENVFEKMKVEEVGKVSKEMNRIFLEMIGADPIANPNTMIQSARLTHEFDIKVFGVNGHELDPDQDLNGASRRAITLAFILALTKISKIEAVNVIDTPLGMMSGFVKRSVLQNLVKESKQIILFLTHAEINGVEDIISEHAGDVYTLTNPGHYPIQLVNKPEREEAAVVKCNCDHLRFCNVCQRINEEH
jgi:DNA sulfur modification protein DndD